MAGPQGTSEAGDVILEVVNRLRVIESKQSQFNEKLLLANQNMIESYKGFLNDIKNVRKEIEEINKELKNVKNVVKHLSEEAANFARKDDVKVLEKYINLWNPLNFVTRQELEKLTAKPATPKKEGAELAKRNSTNR